MQGRVAPSMAWGEFLIVVAIAFGFLIYSSVSAALAPVVEPSFSEGGLWGTVIYELFVLALLCPVLWLRGWKPQELGMELRSQDIWPAVGLLIACMVANYPLTWVGDQMAEGINPSMDAMVAGRLSLSAVVVLSIINPIFEEVFVCAYVIRALERTRSQAFAVNISVAIRASYHLYQGPVGTIWVILVGLIFGWWFARTGRLWPAIIAHGLVDLLALMFYA
ncbi:CPBP family intramembrane glutamic endopeptidase [Pseudoxanthomonas sacheonensis]|uniref:CPBP family intramembrane glutamic endopeptidase n=1 Tax=Pseudoxanthomonas sacheonensis TaxID=443615 RepID=UPI0013D28DCD|nr:type II CAAX endopeptidase family protein [Pseudoxanthomonas sacheonensis]KAF1705914.1 CPBP family intramembrane metalloprotease [Pseudoxanthomonas sacheonensis]